MNVYEEEEKKIRFILFKLRKSNLFFLLLLRRIWLVSVEIQLLWLLILFDFLRLLLEIDYGRKVFVRINIERKYNLNSIHRLLKRFLEDSALGQILPEEDTYKAKCDENDRKRVSRSYITNRFQLLEMLNPFHVRDRMYLRTFVYLNQNLLF